MPVPDAWIAEQLRKGYSRKAVEEALRDTDYAPLAAHQTRSFKLALLLAASGILLLALLAVYFFRPASEAGAAPAAFTGDASAQHNASRSPFGASLCVPFAVAASVVSCEEAMAAALADSPGTVEGVSLETRRIPFYSDEKPSIKSATMWLFTTRLDSAYYDKNLNKTVSSLVIGIGADEHVGIYRQALP